MYGIQDAMARAAGIQKDDPKPGRYVEMFTAMQNRRITQDQMNRVCYAIADTHRESKLLRTNRYVPPDPGKLDKNTGGQKRKDWQARAASYRTAVDQNAADAEWIDEIEAKVGDAFELDETEQAWFDYVTEGGELPC